MLIDSHFHLDMFPDDERDAVVERARAAGVEELVTIGTRIGQSRQLRDLVGDRDGMWCTVGLHPNNVGDEATPTVESIASLANHPKVIGIGESGLDYFYKRAPHEAQQVSFRHHIRAARMTDLPLVIHARAADNDIAAILQDEWDQGGPFKLLLHCFSSGRPLAEAALRLGGYVSFSGMLTFPKSNELREIARDIPQGRLLVETDAPFLAPVPHRGKRNEPAFVTHTAQQLADVRGLSLEAVAALTETNFRRLFDRTA